MEGFTLRTKYGNYEECHFVARRYPDGNRRLDIVSDIEGPIMTVTTTTGQKVPDDMIVVKNYSENEGILDWLRDEGIVSDIAYFLESGYVTLPVCQLTDKGLEITA